MPESVVPPTIFYAFNNEQDAITSARELTGAGYSVVVAGPTAWVELSEKLGDYDDWSYKEDEQIILIIASRDGIDKVASGGRRLPI